MLPFRISLKCGTPDSIVSNVSDSNSSGLRRKSPRVRTRLPPRKVFNPPSARVNVKEAEELKVHYLVLCNHLRFKIQEALDYEANVLNIVLLARVRCLVTLKPNNKNLLKGYYTFKTFLLLDFRVT